MYPVVNIKNFAGFEPNHNECGPVLQVSEPHWSSSTASAPARWDQPLPGVQRSHHKVPLPEHWPLQKIRCCWSQYWCSSWLHVSIQRETIHNLPNHESSLGVNMVDTATNNLNCCMLHSSTLASQSPALPAGSWWGLSISQECLSTIISSWSALVTDSFCVIQVLLLLVLGK